jgi:hypothetical protein
LPGIDLPFLAGAAISGSDAGQQADVLAPRWAGAGPALDRRRRCVYAAGQPGETIVP